LAAVAGVGARLVFASSSSVYGNDDRRPFKEDQMAARPVSPYGATKVAGEALVHAHHALTGLPVMLARLFTVYGPRQRPDLAIHTFATRILRGDPIELYGSGTVPRDYTYVDDVVDALVRMADTDHPRLVVNVGSDRPITNGEMLTALETALGMDAVRRDVPHQPGDALATHADITRAREVLGWQPRTRFEDGIRRFVDWLRAEQPGGR
ncbi:MAG TPA: GDP-mannose 4,6-dehydratase, partial [Candidatus Limnocylindria bacterium]|nr:GDP-mannose 4,6-dehydratase [Candidatus Limnocylindria bacterium]